MKKTMVCLSGAMALCLVAGAAVAGPNPRASAPDVKAQPKPAAAEAQKLTPNRVAGIRRLADGRYELTTPWYPVKEGMKDQEPTLPIFDSYQPDVNAPIGSAAPFGGSECGVPDGARWLLEYTPGTFDFHNPYTVSNMEVADGHDGDLAERVTWLFYWYQQDGSDFHIAFFTSEEVSTDCIPPAEQGDLYEGVIFSFFDAPTGFYYSDADLTPYDLFLQMPTGQGGWTMIIADDFDGEFLTLAAGPTQPGLWSTSNNGGLPNRPGITGNPTWADIDPTDGDLTDNECFDYSYGVCPDPLNNAVVFWTSDDGPIECYPDCDQNDLLNFFDFLCFLSAFQGGDDYSDCDGNDLLNFFDFLCFLSSFQEGCD